MPQNNEKSTNIEMEQAKMIRRMLGHYNTEPKFLAMMVPEFVQYQLSQKQINYNEVNSLEDEFSKDVPITLFFKELFNLFKKYFSKTVVS